MVATAAQWILQSQFGSATSLDTGPVNYIVAWGGSEYGYAYTYAFVGAPSGVTIDSETGLFSIGTPLAANTYTFQVVVTNRIATSLSNTFSISLIIAAGVTSNRTGSQVLYTTYDPFNSALWGSPTGNNWTTVLNKIQTQILFDQTGAGNNLFRATIIFRHGVTYQYTNNHWMTGVQFYRLIEDPAHLSGAKPILQCTNTDPSAYENGPTNWGSGNAVDQQSHGIKSLCALVHDVAVGDSTLTLVNAGDASRIVAGRYHALVGQCIQRGGYPPNVAYIDYASVSSVVGSTVTLDHRVKYRYSSTWFNESGDQDFGAALLVPWDLGGTGGGLPSASRMTFSGYVQNITFLANPNTGDAITYVESTLNLMFDGCTIPNFQVTMCRHVYFKDCTFTASSEPDKMSETVIFDNCTFAPPVTIGGATGFQYWLDRDSHFGCAQVNPRQMRSLRTAHNATGDSQLIVPMAFSYNGFRGLYEFDACTWTANGFHNQDTWTFGYNPGSGSSTPALVIGTDATWSGLTLKIPTSYAHFEDWMVAVYEGMFCATTSTLPVTANYGVVDTLSSNGLGTELWLNFTWVDGTKPLSGNLWPVAKSRELTMASDNTFVSPESWISPGFMKETSSPFGTDWDFPPGENPVPPTKVQIIQAQTRATITAQAVNTVVTPVNGYLTTPSRSTATLVQSPGITFVLTAVSLNATVITNPN